MCAYYSISDIQRNRLFMAFYWPYLRLLYGSIAVWNKLALILQYVRKRKILNDYGITSTRIFLFLVKIFIIEGCNNIPLTIEDKRSAHYSGPC